MWGYLLQPQTMPMQFLRYELCRAKTRTRSKRQNRPLSSPTPRNSPIRHSSHLKHDAVEAYPSGKRLAVDRAGKGLCTRGGEEVFADIQPRNLQQGGVEGVRNFEGGDVLQEVACGVSAEDRSEQGELQVRSQEDRCTIDQDPHFASLFELEMSLELVVFTI